MEAQVTNDNEDHATKTYEKHEVQVGGTTFRIYKHYQVIRIVGSGAFGVVGSGKNLLTNTNVAIKKVSIVLLIYKDSKSFPWLDRCQKGTQRDQVIKYEYLL